MPLLRRQRPSRPVQRLLFPANTLSLLPRQRPCDSRNLPGLPRPRLCAAARQPQGRDSRRSGQRHAAPAQRRRRAEHFGRTAGRLLLRDPRQGTSAVSSRRPGPRLPRADHLFAGLAGGFDQGPHAQRTGTCQRAAGHAAGRSLHAAGPGHARRPQFPSNSRGRGDLHVQITVEVPKRLSDRHEQLLRELAEIENTEVSPKRKSFFEKIKNLFHAEENL